MPARDDALNWNSEAPPGVFAVIIDAAEHTSQGRADAACHTLDTSDADPEFLAVCGVRALAGLVLGPDAAQRFNDLRSQVLELASSSDADDMIVVLSLEVISVAEYYERQQFTRLEEIVSGSQFTWADYASIGAQLCGQVVASWAGENAPLVFRELKRRNGIGGAA
jgi:hypothetical protein